jgi:hypothetical protein
LIPITNVEEAFLGAQGGDFIIFRYLVRAQEGVLFPDQPLVHAPAPDLDPSRPFVPAQGVGPYSGKGLVHTPTVERISKRCLLHLLDVICEVWG